jgi:hypothetical protein
MLILGFLSAGLQTPAAENPPGPTTDTSEVRFDDHFHDNALRFDLYQVGNAAEEIVAIDRIIEEPLWPENRTRLVDPFNLGRYAVKIIDVETGALIFSRGFDSLFGEYKTTVPAADGVRRVFQRPVRIPHPKRPFVFALEVRDRENVLRPLFSVDIDPGDYRIIRGSVLGRDIIHEVQRTGDPRERVDVVIVAEGYTAAEEGKFRADSDRMAGWFFSIEPFKSAQHRFNVTAVLRPSLESSVDEPRQGLFRKTALDASFNALDLDRYLLVDKLHRLREVASQVPYDTIVVMVNSTRYGGGGIYNDYCITTVDNARSKDVFLHEFGHSFAGLADEYYTSEVSYNEFHPPGIEPLEPNITALLDPEGIKWKELLSPGIPIPTPYGKEDIEALQASRRDARIAAAREIEDAKAAGFTDDAIQELRARHKAADEDIAKQILAIRARFRHLEDQVGAFEGAGYAAKGLYRPMMHCIMITSPTGEYCRVCEAAISRMIDYYAVGNSPCPAPPP